MRLPYCFGMILLCLVMSISTLHAQDKDNKDNKDLLDRMETLEKQLKKYEEENKARKSLEVTEEEKISGEKEVLEAVSREYTLSPRGTLSLDYSLGYSYGPSESITTQNQVLNLERFANHTITHSISTTYGLLDNINTSLTLPILYRYNKRGTKDSLDQSDLGDISLGLTFQLPPRFQLPADISSTYSISSSFPTGRSPYKINPKTELSTGGGTYDFALGSSFSKQMDPVVLFWSLGYSYSPPLSNLNYKVLDTYTLEKVESGNSFSFGMGMGYSLSYNSSLNMSFSYQYIQSSTLTYKELADPIKPGDSVSASYGIGMGVRVSPKTTMSISLSQNLTSSGFSLSVRLPFDFVL